MLLITFRTTKKTGGVGREFSPKMRALMGKRLTEVSKLYGQPEVIFMTICTTLARL